MEDLKKTDEDVSYGCLTAIISMSIFCVLGLAKMFNYDGVPSI